MKRSNLSLRLAQILLLVGVCCVLGGGLAMSVREKPVERAVMASESAPISATPVMLAGNPEAPKQERLDIVTLTSENTVVMDEAFDDQSVTQVMLELKKLSEAAPKSATLYLVLNTPGGSVTAGQSLMSFAKALPQEVKTLTIFAASMGFQTVQGLGERLILDTGTLMSHRAKFGVSGQGPGELFSRLRYIMATIDALDAQAASRMKMSFDEYRALIYDEYWVFGKEAVRDHAADRMVLARCDKSMNGSRSSAVATPFGLVSVERSKCPLMPGILSVKAASEVSDEASAKQYATKMFTDRNNFFREYVLTGKYN